MKTIKTILSTSLIIISILFVLITLDPYSIINILLEINPSTINICDAFMEIYNDDIGFTILECVSILIIATWTTLTYLEGFNDGVKHNKNN